MADSLVTILMASSLSQLIRQSGKWPYGFSQPAATCVTEVFMRCTDFSAIMQSTYRRLEGMTVQDTEYDLFVVVLCVCFEACSVWSLRKCTQLVILYFVHHTGDFCAQIQTGLAACQLAPGTARQAGCPLRGGRLHELCELM